MAYSLLIQQTMDLDLFFKDVDKYIHIASGGGHLPQALVENDLENDAFSILVDDMAEQFEIEINPDLNELLNLRQDQLGNYLSDFISMARKGFHSYDKSNLGEFGNVSFHLVARPRNNQDVNLKEAARLTTLKNRFPNNFKGFDLFQCFGEKNQLK